MCINQQLGLSVAYGADRLLSPPRIIAIVWSQVHNSLFSRHLKSLGLNGGWWGRDHVFHDKEWLSNWRSHHYCDDAIDTQVIGLLPLGQICSVHSANVASRGGKPILLPYMVSHRNSRPFLRRERRGSGSLDMIWRAANCNMCRYTDWHPIRKSVPHHH